MIPVLLIIIVIAVILIVLTFFMNDKFNELENQIEQNSISALQDTYQIKKQLKILEEELLTEGFTETKQSTNIQRPFLIQKVYDLYKDGYSTDEIVGETRLDRDAVQAIINNSK